MGEIWPMMKARMKPIAVVPRISAYNIPIRIRSLRETPNPEAAVGSGSAVGTVTFLYRHDVGMVTHRILHGQHAFLRSIRASAHAHLGEETCLEVVIMEGSPQEIKKLTDRLKAVRGVLFAEAVTTSPDLP